LYYLSEHSSRKYFRRRKKLGGRLVRGVNILTVVANLTNLSVLISLANRAAKGDGSEDLMKNRNTTIQYRNIGKIYNKSPQRLNLREITGRNK